MKRSKWTWTGDKPWKHQVKALRKMLALRGGALLMPVRSGKTRVAIDFARASEMKWGIDQVLVVCPKSVKGVWRQQIKKYAGDSHLRWVIVNYDKLYDRAYDPDFPRSWEPVRSEKLTRYCQAGKTLLIIDEAHKVGDPTTVQSREAYVLSTLCSLKLSLTGTPWHRRPMLIFGHYKILDDSIFGTSWKAFKAQYGLWGGYNKHVLLKHINLERMRKKVAQKAFILKEVPERAPVHEVIPVKLEKSGPMYDVMAREAVIKLKSGAYASGEIVLTKMLRLSQITGGWVRDEEDQYHRVGTEKKETFEGLMETLRDGEVKKVVVFARFLHELADAARVLQEMGYNVYLMYGRVSDEHREQRMADFDEDYGQAAFVSQISTGSLGIDLSSATTVIFYSHSYSLVDFDQACGRIKKFREKRPLTYYHLLAENTIDEVVFLTLREKRDLADVLLRHPDLIQRG